MAGPSDPHSKIPVIGAPKPRKAEKSYWFDLKLCESNDETYPEFSWSELVAERKTHSTKDRLKAGHTLLDPNASDDEDDIRAMAARFEAKYGNGKPSKYSKRKRQAEDYIDRGAGYDESDSFIDNSDAYDEVVPADLETVRGGFYINSGSLDFREVEISDEELTQEAEKKNGKISAPPASSSVNPVSTKPNIKRPSLTVTKKHGSVPSKSKVRDSIKSKVIANVMKAHAVPKSEVNSGIKKSSSVQDSSSSDTSTSGTSSSEESSSSSDSSSSVEEDEEEDKKSTKEVQKPVPSVVIDSAPPVKRLKTKNVPPNPALAKNKLISSGNLPVVNSSKEMIVTSSTPSAKITAHPGQSISPGSNLSLTITPGISPSSIKVPTPKLTPTSSSSSTTALNLVRSNKTSKTKQRQQNPKKNLVMPYNPSQAEIQQNLLQLVAASIPPPAKLKKAKVKSVPTSKNVTPSAKQSLHSHQHNPPPKLKAKPKLTANLPPSTMHSGNLSQLASFSRISQPPPLSAQTVEITKIKPAHSSSSPSSINTFKNLSNLGSGITVTEVKEKSGNSQHSHLTSSAITSSSAVTVSSSNLGTHNPRSRSPSVVAGSNTSTLGSSRISQSLTITPSSLLNLSTSSSHSSNAGNISSNSTNPNSITLANINMLPPSSRGSSNSHFGQPSTSMSKKSITPYNINNILSSSQTDLLIPTSAPSNKADFMDAAAYGLLNYYNLHKK